MEGVLRATLWSPGSPWQDPLPVPLSLLLPGAGSGQFQTADHSAHHPSSGRESLGGSGSLPAQGFPSSAPKTVVNRRNNPQ